MPISNKIYPRTGDTQTVYLKNVNYKSQYKNRGLHDVQ